MWMKRRKVMNVNEKIKKETCIWMKCEGEMNVNEKKEINEWEWNERNKIGNLYLNEMK